MTEIKIDLDQVGIAQFMQGPEVTADITARVKAVAEAASAEVPGPAGQMAYRVYLSAIDHHGQRRVRGEVWTDTQQARIAEAENRALTRSLDAGRL